LELNMNGLVVLAACVCASSAQLIARAVLPGHQSHQFHAQDEFGQFSFGHAGGPSARTESRNAYGVTQGSYQYLDANGLIQTVQYISDAGGFRVVGSNLPVGPAAPAVVAVAGPEPVVDTPEVAAAKAEFQAAFDAAAAAAAAAPEEAAAAEEETVVAEERKKRDADNVVLPAAYGYGLPLTYNGGYALPAAAGLLPYPYATAAGLLAAAPADIVAKVEPAEPVEVAELPAVPTYAAGIPAVLPAATYGAIAPAAAVLPAAGVYGAVAPAAAVPTREATLTEIKLNPGHATFYRVD